MKLGVFGIYSIFCSLFIAFLALAGCKESFTLDPAKPSDAPTMTDTPCAFCSPTPTKTATNTFTATATKTSTGTPTVTRTPTTPVGGTPTVNPTATIPMGLVISAAFDGSIINVSGFSVTISGNEVGISYNRAADATAAVTLITPSNGNLVCSWVQDIPMGTYTLSQYVSSTQFIYTPNAVYSVAVSGTWGTAFASMNAPGGITFSVNGASVTAAYPGNIDEAIVQESAPSPKTTFTSDPAVSVGSPYVYLSSAFPDIPGTYSETYSVGLTVTSFTGTGGAQGAFVGNQTLSNTFSR